LLFGVPGSLLALFLFASLPLGLLSFFLLAGFAFRSLPLFSFAGLLFGLASSFLLGGPRLFLGGRASCLTLFTLTLDGRLTPLQSGRTIIGIFPWFGFGLLGFLDDSLFERCSFNDLLVARAAPDENQCPNGQSCD
jgi:hypothetical protein